MAAFNVPADLLRLHVETICADYRHSQEYEVNWCLTVMRAISRYPFLGPFDTSDIEMQDLAFFDVLSFLRLAHPGFTRPLRDDFRMANVLLTHIGVVRLLPTCKRVVEAYYEQYGQVAPTEAMYQRFVDQTLLDDAFNDTVKIAKMSPEELTASVNFRSGWSIDDIAKKLNVSVDESEQLTVKATLVLWRALYLAFAEGNVALGPGARMLVLA